MKGFLAGAALGAGAMYFLDPGRGNRRRALVRDKIIHTMRVERDFLGKAQRDFWNRIDGLLEKASRSTPREASDAVLEARVRTKLGRASSHPGAIEVVVADGSVILSGPILTAEHERVLSQTRRVRGVSEIKDQLEDHDRPENIPALQGGGHVPRRLPRMSSPLWRVSSGATGAALTTYGSLRRGMRGMLAGLLGSALILQSIGAGNIGSRKSTGKTKSKSRARADMSGGESGDTERLFPDVGQGI
jgi:osmotically-inducible protein OsmY